MKYLQRKGDIEYNVSITKSLDTIREDALLILKMKTKGLDIIR